MKKILLALLLVSALLVPAVGKAATILEECTLRHNLGERICSEQADPAERLTKGCKVITGTGTGAQESVCDLKCLTVSNAKVTGRDGSVVCLIDFMHTISDWIFAVFLVIAVLMLVFAGIEFVTAGGNPEKVTGARTKIIYAIVGLAVAFLARGLVRVIEALVA